MLIMDEILSITKLARLRNVSTETLRHYDRIGLLKPDKIREPSNERYYSIYQYEKLGTIKELKQMGLSLKEIKTYFDNRNVEVTQKLLSKGLNDVTEKINDLMNLKQSIEGKLDFLRKLENLNFDSTIEIKTISEDRYYLFSERNVKSEVELSYEAIKLEATINKNEQYLPIFASNRFAGMYYDQENSPILGIQIDREYENKVRVSKISKGNYLTLMYKGEFFEGARYIQKLLNYAKDNGLLLEQKILQVQWLDYTFVENKDEVIYEIQCKIR